MPHRAVPFTWRARLVSPASIDSAPMSTIMSFFTACWRSSSMASSWRVFPAFIHSSFLLRGLDSRFLCLDFLVQRRAAAGLTQDAANKVQCSRSEIVPRVVGNLRHVDMYCCGLLAQRRSGAVFPVFQHLASSFPF